MTQMLGEGREIDDGKWLRWDGRKQYNEYLELTNLKELAPDNYERLHQQGEGMPAAYACLYYDASAYSMQTVIPGTDWDENGTVLKFYANYQPLLQWEAAE